MRSATDKLVSSLRSRSRMCGVAFAFDTSDWQFALLYFHNSCAVCGERESSPSILVADHWVPIVDGGCTVRSNIVPLCRRCNSAKSWMDAKEWLLKKLGETEMMATVAKIEAFFDVTDHRPGKRLPTIPETERHRRVDPHADPRKKLITFDDISLDNLEWIKRERGYETDKEAVLWALHFTRTFHGEKTGATKP